MLVHASGEAAYSNQSFYPSWNAHQHHHLKLEQERPCDFAGSLPLSAYEAYFVLFWSHLDPQVPKLAPQDDQIYPLGTIEESKNVSSVGISQNRRA
jgi:hypothetical protein